MLKKLNAKTACAGLTIRRKLGERVLIGEDVLVEVSSIEGGAVKLRIVAPANVVILREELRERAGH